MSIHPKSTIESIHEARGGVASKADAESCVGRMIDTPSSMWRVYLDQVHAASNDPHQAVSGVENIKLRVLSRYEDELYGSVAEGIADDDGLVAR